MTCQIIPCTDSWWAVTDNGSDGSMHPYMEKSPPSCIMSSEEPQVEGKFIRGRTVIENPDMCNALKIKGYGEIEKERFVLTSFETLYLVYVRRLTLKKGGTIMSFDGLIQAFQKTDEDIMTKFLIYRDLRTRGYVVKDGFGFGSDFRAYERGHFGDKGAKYLIFALNEGRQEKIGLLQNKISEITRMGKEPIIAVIERRGEVIYYKISEISFPANKFRVTAGS